MNELKIGNVEASALAKKYGTPLYVYDTDKIGGIITDYVENFKSDKFKTEIIFASKAFSIKEMIRLVDSYNISLECVSLGEFRTAEAVGFDYKKIYFHGNNKSHEELIHAVENEIGEIVVDNLMELEVLEEICKDLGKKAHILIRINSGVDAHTHKYIVTSHIDSKFGVIFDSADYKNMIKLISKSKNIILDGIHSHIGSQIFDMNAFYAAIDKLMGFLKSFDRPMTLDLGGGFSVVYTKDDVNLDKKVISKDLVAYIEKKLVDFDMKLDKVCIEPGRSIVAEAGYTLHTIGYIKKTPNKEYYFVDGGMTDNIRPALYQAKYNADIIGKFDMPKDHIVTVAGKCCESGDIVIEGIALPKADKGDILVTYTTGAYGYSMSNNYNKALTPAVVFVGKGISKLVVRRQTYEELLEREV